MSKKNKALGIGNAIVDAVCKIDENFLKSHNLQKGTMKLIDNELGGRLVRAHNALEQGWFKPTPNTNRPKSVWGQIQ